MKQSAAITSVAAAMGMSPLMSFINAEPQTDEFVRSKEK
jgi:hypothetical protein